MTVRCAAGAAAWASARGDCACLGMQFKKNQDEQNEKGEKRIVTKIKLCGMARLADIDAVNELMPEYIGFIFVPGRRRNIAPEAAEELKRRLLPGIQAVGVFINEEPERVAQFLRDGLIDIAQLHGTEDEDYIKRLRVLTKRPLIKAFRIETEKDIRRAEACTADYVLLDSGIGGTGRAFDWTLLRQMRRPYFLAGGLMVENVRAAVEQLHPYAVDVSSGIETDGVKDQLKMREFVRHVRGAG